MAMVFYVPGTVSKNASSGECVFLKVCGQPVALGTPQPSS